MRWLRLGWSDLWSNKWVAVFYGTCFWSMALILGLVFRTRPEYVMSIASGCLLADAFFGAVPDRWVWLGAAIIFASTLYVANREHMAHHAAADGVAHPDAKDRRQT